MFYQSYLRGLPARVFCAALILFSLAGAAAAQYDRFEKERTLQMLSNVKSALQKNYYDPTFHGVDLEERFKAAAEKVKQATTISAAHGAIAQALIDLNDSHTFFVPPQKAAKVEYGWQMRAIGDKAYIIAVKPGSDAEHKGLKVGDMVLALNGFKPARSEMWKMNYYYYQIGQRGSMTLVVQSPGQEPRQLEVITKVTPLKRVIDISNNIDLNDLIRSSENESRSTVHKFVKVGNVMVWNMPQFDLSPSEIDRVMDTRIKGSGALVLDLRGNPGGRVDSLERLAGYFFDKEMKIADLKGRKSTEISKAVPHGADTFKGNLVILVDSRSASASEVLSRMMQIEKRGYVIGDQSAGAVMESKSYSMQLGNENLIFYGMSITAADVIMTDGKSLEHIGVTPDELVLPTGADMAASRDVALAKAIEKAGGKASPEEAGKFFPIEWDN